MCLAAYICSMYTHFCPSWSTATVKAVYTVMILAGHMYIDLYVTPEVLRVFWPTAHAVMVYCVFYGVARDFYGKPIKNVPRISIYLIAPKITYDQTMKRD